MQFQQDYTFFKIKGNSLLLIIKKYSYFRHILGLKGCIFRFIGLELKAFSTSLRNHF
jgi:hypothetical protein